MKMFHVAGLAAGLASAAMVLSMGMSAMAQVHGAPQAPSGQTQTLQPGADQWMANPNMRAYYEATKAAFANGPDKVDVAAYEAKSKEIFIAFADSMKADRKLMLDHLKDIPKQMVQIVKDDPKTLDSYENFRIALVGPQ